MADPKERPILFSAPMVRALLSGTKTQTRRVMARQKQHDFTDYTLFGQKGHPDDEAERRGGWAEPWVAVEHAPDWPDGKDDRCRCPYADQRGDRLWVCESFSGIWLHKNKPPSAWERTDDMWYWADGNPDYGDWPPPKPSIHMPRWASRILLEVTDVRIQRLQDISDTDALAEGVDADAVKTYADKGATLPAMRAYRDVWGAINGHDGPVSWAANPWVWAVSFSRITP